MSSIDERNGGWPPTGADWDRRRADAAWRQRFEERINERFAELEKRLEPLLDDHDKKRHNREALEDFSRWLGYIGKIIVIVGAVVGAVAWVAKYGG